MSIPHALHSFLEALDCADPSDGTLSIAPDGKFMRTFTSDGNLVNACNKDITVEFLGIGGGGGGGEGSSSDASGGGGAGGVEENLSVTIKAGESIPIRPGAGGAVNADGGDSIMWVDGSGFALDPATDPKPSGTRAVGGGAGGGGNDAGNGGGSGGGGGTQLSVGSGQGGGAGTTGQGNDGGDGQGQGGGSICARGAGGGGGSLAGAGQDGSIAEPAVGGAGGAATVLSDWDETAGGGGDGGAAQFQPAGATNCDNVGGVFSDPGSPGETGTGAGGGGGARGSGATAGTDGVIKVKYVTSSYTPTSGTGSISQTTSGLIFRDQFNRTNRNLDGDNGWSETNPGSFAITANEVLDKWATNEGRAVLQNLGDQEEVILQVNADRNGSSQIVVQLVANADSVTAYESGSYYLNEKSTVDFQVTKVGTGGLGSGGTFEGTDPHGVRFVIDKSVSPIELRAYKAPGLSNLQDLSVDFELQASGTDSGTEPTGAYYGVQGGDGSNDLDTQMDEFFACGRGITITGLPVGWSVQVDSRTRRINSVSGDMVLDVDTWAFPATSIKLYDGDGNLEDTLSPASGIWGGDEYNVTIS